MPALPNELGGVWQKFMLLGPHRAESGFNFQEMMAFSAATSIYISHWEATVLMRMNDAALRAWRNENYQRDANPDLVDQIPVTNTKGLKGLFLGLKERHKNKDKDKQPECPTSPNSA